MYVVLPLDLRGTLHLTSICCGWRLVFNGRLQTSRECGELRDRIPTLLHLRVSWYCISPRAAGTVIHLRAKINPKQGQL